MKVKVLFSGILADITGTEMKFYSDVKSLDHLKLRVADDFSEIVHYKFCLSLNDEIKNGDALLKDNDEVAFLFPFDGG